MTGFKPPKTSVALSYDAIGAPTVTASGDGVVAEAIIERAREFNVPVIEDPKLANLLSKVPLGEEIPVELYQAIAEILVFILRLEMTIDDHA
jgi:flagellar biosynthesis protein